MHESSAVVAISAPAKAIKVPTPKVAVTIIATGARRHFECTEDGAAKFWKVSRNDANVTTRWGKIGTMGHEKTKACASADKAQAGVEKLLLEKLARVTLKFCESAEDGLFLPQGNYPRSRGHLHPIKQEQPKRLLSFFDTVRAWLCHHVALPNAVALFPS